MSHHHLKELDTTTPISKATFNLSTRYVNKDLISMTDELKEKMLGIQKRALPEGGLLKALLEFKESDTVFYVMSTDLYNKEILRVYENLRYVVEQDQRVKREIVGRDEKVRTEWVYPKRNYPVMVDMLDPFYDACLWTFLFRRGIRLSFTDGTKIFEGVPKILILD